MKDFGGEDYGFLAKITDFLAKIMDFFIFLHLCQKYIIFANVYIAYQ